jgi:hypothetical protein
VPRMRIFVTIVVVSSVLLIAGFFLFLSDDAGRDSAAAPTRVTPPTTEPEPPTDQARPPSEPTVRVSPSTSDGLAPPPADSPEAPDSGSHPSDSESSTETAAPAEPPAPEGTSTPSAERIPAATLPPPTPTDIAEDCCQCTALGRDQDVPFHPEPGYTCAELCMRGCLKRQKALVCKMGGVSGRPVACTDGP